MMLPKELLQVLKLSGGKIIVSEGEIEQSYVVMSLGEYLKEQEQKREEIGSLSAKEGQRDEVGKVRAEVAEDGLTNDALLDRINADIAELHQRKNEIELERELAEKGGEEEGEGIRYEEVR
jgi:hypothetical protein